jgi:hypothetical protein
MTKVLSGKELDQAAIDASIARAPFNAHEKSSVSIHRNVMALMYKDGYKASEAAHADYRALEEELAALRVRVGDVDAHILGKEELAKRYAALLAEREALSRVVEADKDYDEAMSMKVSATNGDDLGAAECALNEASDARRLAMEALK